MDEQLEFDLMRTCRLSVLCRRCGASLHEEIGIGSSVDPVLKKHGWVRRDDGFLCDSCSTGRT